jgi:hypothetical protein
VPGRRRETRCGTGADEHDRQYCGYIGVDQDDHRHGEHPAQSGERHTALQLISF